MRGHPDTQNGTMKIHFGSAKTELSFSLLKCLSYGSPHLLAVTSSHFAHNEVVTGTVLELAVLPMLVNAVASTDEYSDAVRTLVPCAPIFWD
jgi:hypothetical protein